MHYLLLILWLTLNAVVMADELKVEAVSMPANASEVGLREPFGVDFQADGSMLIVDFKSHTLLKRSAAGELTRLAGTGVKGFAGNGKAGLSAQFDGLHTLVVAKSGLVYLADTWNHQIRTFDPKTGKVDVFAGTGKKGFAGDGGPARDAEFNEMYSIALTPDESSLVLLDLANRRIRRIDMKTGIITTVAGNGQKGKPTEGGNAVTEPLVDPRAVTCDAEGNIFMLERAGHAVRKIDSAGRITTLAGTGQKGYSGDGGPGLKAKLNGPKHIAMDKKGRLLICDTENHCIRRYDQTSKVITTIVGTGSMGASLGDGKGTSVAMRRPHGVIVGPDGALYISDSENARILRASTQE